MQDKVTILSVNYNGGRQNLKLLNSIKKLKYPQNRLEVIIVDNHSTDGSFDLVKNKFPKINLIRQKTNLGYGPALNIGIKRAKGHYVFIVNNDIIIDPNCLNVLRNLMKKSSDNTILGPKLIPVEQNRPTATLQKFNYWTGHVNMKAQQIRKISSVEWIQGCAMFSSKQTFKKIGYFDEGFEKIYFEDLDLCKRAQKLGIKTQVNPKALVYHVQSHTIDKIPLSFKWFYWHKNKIRFAVKHASFLQVVSIILFDVLASAYWTIIRRQPNFTNLIKALVANYKNLPTTLKSRRQI